jgi:hypothetical protein
MSDSRESDEARPDEAVIDGHEPSEDAETEFHPFDEIHEDFKPSPAVRVIGSDGLPVTIDSTEKSDIPPLSPASLVCMADTRAFVVRDRWGAVGFEFSPELVERAPDGRWRIPVSRLIDGFRGAIAELRQRMHWDEKESDAEDVWSVLYDRCGYDRCFTECRIGDFLLVEPIRPACRHYVRQKLAFELNAQHNQFARLCSARRTTEGTFMTVKDTGVWACDMRDPYDAESSKELDDFDALKVAQGKNREHLPMFGWRADTRGESTEVGGIFSKGS